MAITFDATLRAAFTTSANTTNNSFTTTSASAAGARVIVLISYWNDLSSVTSVTIGGVAATKDGHVSNGSDQYDVWSREVAAGLASGATIAYTFSSAAGASLVGVASFLGIASTGFVVTTASATGTGAPWASGTATNTGSADALFVGGAGNETPGSVTSTPSGGTIELFDTWLAGALQGFTVAYKIASAVASDSLSGNWSASTSTATTGLLVIYAGLASAVKHPQRMPLGV